MDKNALPLYVTGGSSGNSNQLLPLPITLASAALQQSAAAAAAVSAAAAAAEAGTSNSSQDSLPTDLSMHIKRERENRS